MADLETLELKIKDSSEQAVAPLQSLANALKDLKSVGSVTGLKTTAKGIESLQVATSKITSSSATKLNNLIKSVNGLQSLANVKLSTTLPNNITKIASSINVLPADSTAKIAQLASALTPLTQLGKTNLSTFVKQIGNLGDVINNLDGVDLEKFAKQMKAVAVAIAPLADEMNKVSAGFSALPTKLKSITSASYSYNNSVKSMTETNKLFYNSFINIGTVVYLLYRIGSVLGTVVKASNAYQENLNLFTASMGKYTVEAMEYAEQVSEIMGIDVSEWIRNQGVFQTMATGFGIPAEQAEIMSRNLTQLGYDKELSLCRVICIEEQGEPTNVGCAA